MPDNTYPNANGNTVLYNEGRVVGYSISFITFYI